MTKTRRRPFMDDEITFDDRWGDSLSFEHEEIALLPDPDAEPIAHLCVRAIQDSREVMVELNHEQVKQLMPFLLSWLNRTGGGA